MNLFARIDMITFFREYVKSNDRSRISLLCAWKQAPDNVLMHMYF